MTSTKTKKNKQAKRPVEQLTEKQRWAIIELESADTLAWSVPTVDRDPR